MPLDLMLATGMDAHEDPSRVIARLCRSGQWVFEFKFDGIRGLATIRNGAVTITNRNGRDITVRYPDVVESLTGLPDMTIDGEIVCPGPDGSPDFTRAHRRDAQSNPFRIRQMARACPARLVAFDVLEHGGDLRRMPYVARRKALEALGRQAPGRFIVPPTSSDGAMMWAVVRDMDLEGLVAKRADSIYVGRRGKTWMKIKRTGRVSVLVTGFEPGKGSRASTFGALGMGLLDADGDLVDVGSVGSGFGESDLRRIWKMLQAEEEIIVEVEYLDVGPTGILRQPVFKGLRTDIPASSCAITQVAVTAPAK